MLSALGWMNWAPVLGLCQEPRRFTGAAYKSSFNSASWAWEVGLRTYFLNPISCPQPLVMASVGKGCIISRIGCDFHVFAQGWFG